VELPEKDHPVAVVELDEMHTYVGSKKTTVGYGLLLIDLQDGSSRLCAATGILRQARNYTTVSKTKK